MKGLCALLASGLLLLGPAAWAQSNELKRRTQDPERLAPFGLLLDAGLPEGTGLSAVLRPSRYMRLHLGGTHNGLRLGGRAGVTLLPWRSGYSPSVTLEVGHAFAGDANKLARRLADRTQPPCATLERVGYTYASTHLGFELGEPRRYVFFVRGGMNWVQLNVPNVEALGDPFITKLGASGAEGGRFLFGMPSAKLGLIVYFG